MTSILQRAYKSTLGIYERKNLKPWDKEPATSLPVYGLYHVFCDAQWEELVEEQIERLRKSGLLDRTKTLYVSCIAKNNHDIERLKALLGGEKVEFVSLTTDPRRYEFPALDFIYEKSQEENFLFYYFHTKGVTYQTLVADATFLAFYAKIVAWRRLMEYFLMDKWRVAVNTLTDSYDTYGCYLFPPFKNIMYAGNFWWARSDYFRTLPRLSEETKLHNRFMAEEWLLSNKAARPFSAFDTVADLYLVRIPDTLYADGKRSWWDAIRFCTVYTLRKYQKKWFGYSYKKHCQERFQRLKASL